GFWCITGKTAKRCPFKARPAMPPGTPRDPIYRGRRFSVDVIELCVRWYITYRLSYRDLVAMMAERGVAVTHTTIMRWVLRYVPEYEKRWARFSRPVGSSWRMDETAVSIRGGAHYLYRAVDREGKSVDSLLCSERTTEAAQAFLQKAVATPGAGWPSTINLDGYTPSHRAVRLLGQEDARWQSVTLRNSRYLNNIVEQDHRAIKRRCASMLGFKTARTAAVTLSGIELAHRIRKQQFLLDLGEQGRPAGDRSLKKLWERALTAEPVPAGCASNLPPSMHRNSAVRRVPLPRVRSDMPRRYPRKVFSGGGLYMYRTPSGGKYWRYKYRYGGKEKTLSLGAYPEVSSESARARHLLARQLLAAGVDPALRRERVRCCSTLEHEHSVRPMAALEWYE
ncbi:MAG: family transposase, partial [Gammaproteobacteria bacterium]|nr:family transposase [Gammaproteobacteria bacterium]